VYVGLCVSSNTSSIERRQGNVKVIKKKNTSKTHLKRKTQAETQAKTHPKTQVKHTQNAQFDYVQYQFM